jgi:AcrR family transcriptional regulator
VGRWEPDARGRLAQAALELYAEAGYEQTTVADIAVRAGVTERTFFRYFADKREVLFDGSGELQRRVLDGVAAAPASLPPVDAAARAFEDAASFLEERREPARTRAATIAANPSLQERELLKLASLGTAVAGALRARGVAEPAATLAAETGVTIFRVGFEKWIARSSGTLAGCIGETLDELRTALTAAV